nr:hypothetical protein [Tanacetum cinerariifolium]
MNQNIDFFGSNQIQNPQYPNVQENPLTNDEFDAYTKANDDKVNNLEIEFHQFQKKCEQKQEDFLNQMRNFMQNFHDGPPIPPPGMDKEHEATKDTELPSIEDIQPLSVQESPQNSDMRQLIREECCVEVPEKQKQSMEDTMLELIKNCQEKEFICIHDDEVKNVVEQPAERGNRRIQSLQNFRIVHKSSISLNTSQISSIHAIAPFLSTKEPEHSLSMGYEHLSITPETVFDEVTESNAENLLPIPSECEVTSEDEIECDMPAKDDCSLAFTTFSNPLFKDNDDLDSSYKKQAMLHGSAPHAYPFLSSFYFLFLS